MPPKRGKLSLSEKIKILDELKTGERVASVARRKGLNEATVRTIKKNEIAIRKVVSASSHSSISQTYYARDFLVVKTELALLRWLEGRQQNGLPVDSKSIKTRAELFYGQFKSEEEPPADSSASKHSRFRASNAWLTKFMERNSLKNIIKERRKVKAESTSTEVEDIKPILSNTDSEEEPNQVAVAPHFEKFMRQSIEITSDVENNVATYDDPYEDEEKEKKFSEILLTAEQEEDEEVISDADPLNSNYIDCKTNPAPAIAKRGKLSLSDKIQILDELKLGERVASVARRKGLNHATVRTIKKNEMSIRKVVSASSALSIYQTYHARDVLLVKTEHALVRWLEDQRQEGILLDNKAIKARAKQFYVELKEEELSNSADAKYANFSASNGWLRKFLYRNSLHNGILKGEGTIVKPKEESTIVKPKEESTLVHVEIETAIPKIELETESEEEICNCEAALSTSLIRQGLEMACDLENYFLSHDPNTERSAQFQRDIQKAMESYRVLYEGQKRNCHSA